MNALGEWGNRSKKAAPRPRPRITAIATAFATMAALLATLGPQIAAQAAPASCGTGDPTVASGTCDVTIDARDFASGDPLANFNYIINVDNSKLPNDPLALNSESFSPIVRTGGQGRPTVSLPDGRYLVSVRSLDHKLWGAYFTLPDDAADNSTLTVRVDLTEQSADHPLPLGRITTYVFEDRSWTNGAPDAEEAVGNGAQGMQGFKVELTEETGSEVTVDYFNNPLCGGVCLTDSDGFNDIDNLGPAGYNIDVHPPDACNPDPNAPNRLTTGPGQWYQTTTIDGGLSLVAPVEEGSDGTGAPGEQLWEPVTAERTGYFFGFVCAPMDFATPGTGEIVGRARNWVEWAPYTFGTFTDPVDFPFVAVTDSATDITVAVTRGDADGHFDIQNVPAGSYIISVWDEQLNYIMRFKYITVAAGQTVNVNETGDDGSVGLGVSRWFGWLDGHVYKDVNGNGKYDPGTDTPLANTDMDQRWRDGSIKEGTFTDTEGYYVYPTAEGGALGRWFVNEQGFARFSSFPGASAYDEHTGAVIPSCVTDGPVPDNPCIPNAQGGGLLMNQLVLEGHRATVDWGKRDYPPGTPGQIVGITYFATTRNEFNAKFQAHEDYEPAVPDATVLLETPGPDGDPNTNDDVVVNKYVTDHWQQPNADQDPQDNGQGGPNSFTQSCNPLRDYAGNDITNQLNPKIGPNCLEVPLTGIQTKDGAFDGGYAFADYCPDGYNLADDDGTCNRLDPNGATTLDDSLVLDPDILASDAGKTVLGAGIPAGATIVSVTPGVSFVMSAPATATDAPVALTIVGGSDPAPLVAGNYIVHSIMPTDPTDIRDCNLAGQTQRVTNTHGDVPGGGQGCLFHIVREEDVNVDLGNHFAPQIPPPDCVGDPHVIDQATLTPRSIYWTGDQSTSPSRPLCDKHLVVLQNGQNANADFFLMTNFRTDPNGETVANYSTSPDPATLTGDVAEPGRFVGQVFNDIYFETNPESPWYGEPLPIGGIPVGIYARVDTVCPDGGTTGCGPTPNVNLPYDSNRWRLLTTVYTSPDGSFEALVPSTETWNCPIPQGPCPGMYLITVDDPGTKDHPNAGYDPNLLTATTPASAWPGLTNPTLDLPLDPISGTGCDFSLGGAASTVPELLQAARVGSLTIGGVPVVGPVIQASDSGTARRITISADFISTGVGTVRLTDDRTGAVTNLTSGTGIVSWTRGSSGGGNPATPDTIVISVPAVSSTFLPGPKQLTIINSTAGGGLSSVNGITVHVLGSNSSVTYTPTIVGVPEPPPAGSNPHALQAAIDGAASGSLLMLSPGTYNENVLVWKPLRIQGVGPGGIIGAHELGQRAPEDPRFKVKGSIIDGRFFPENATDYATTVAAHAPYAVDSDFSTILRGGDITVAAKTASAYDVATLPAGQDSPAFNGARIDGLGLQTGHGITGIGDVGGAGGIQLQANINNIQLTNNILENNSGGFAGGIGVGQPYAHGNHNYNVRIANDRVLGNGGLSRSGGVGIFYGSNNYEVARSIFCSNFGVEYGAGVSHWGWSPRGSIHDNQIYYNDAVDSGAGIAIQNEIPGPTDPRTDPNSPQYDPNFLGDGSGSVNVDRNLIQSNYSGDDGGGIFIQDAFAAPINIRNNMIVDNGAADIGGAITLDDAANVRIVNDTIANNVSTDSSEGSTPGVPHAAGLASEANDPRVAAVLATRTDTVGRTAGSPVVSDPSIKASDLGKSVSGIGIAGNTTTIIAVNPGVGFTMSSNAINGGTGSWTIYTLGVSANGMTPDFSNPRGLFSNIFWDNQAYTLDQFGPGATLTAAGFIDFEVHGTTNNADTFTPRFSDLTNGQILGPNGVLHAVPGTLFTPPLPQYLGSQANFSADPAFVVPFTLALTVGGSRGDPQTAAVTITGADPPVGLTGDYHVATTPPVVDRGAGFSDLGAPAPMTQTPTTSPSVVSILAPCSGTTAQSYPADYDREVRPQLRTTRGRTPWDVGADELPKTSNTPVIVIPGGVNLPGNANDATFGWNGAGQLQCSDSTETR